MASSDKRPVTIIDLDYSIQIDGTKVQQLSMRRPTVRDQMFFEDGKGSEARRIVNYLANLCEVSPDNILELDQSDFSKLTKIIEGFQSPQQEN